MQIDDLNDGYGFGGEENHDPNLIPVENNGRLDMGDITKLTAQDFAPEKLQEMAGQVGGKTGRPKQVKTPVSWERSNIDPDSYRPVVEVEPFGSIVLGWRKGMIFEKEERRSINMLIMNAVSEFVWGLQQFNVQRKANGGIKLRENSKFKKLEARDLDPTTIKDIEDSDQALMLSEIPFEAFSEDTGEAEWSWIVDEILTASFNEDMTNLDMPDTISVSRHDKGQFTKKALFKIVEESITDNEAPYPIQGESALPTGG